jgi:hypothetical protein
MIPLSVLTMCFPSRLCFTTTIVHAIHLNVVQMGLTKRGSSVGWDLGCRSFSGEALPLTLTGNSNPGSPLWQQSSVVKADGPGSAFFCRVQTLWHRRFVMVLDANQVRIIPLSCSPVLKFLKGIDDILVVASSRFSSAFHQTLTPTPRNDP